MDEVHKLYKSQGYTEIHGMDILISITLMVSTLIISGTTTYQGLLAKIRSDWKHNRCSPILLPFAGYIMPVPGKTGSEVTYDNLTYCMKMDVSKVFSIALMPLEFSLYVTVEFLDKVEEGIRYTMEAIRYLLNKLTEERDKIYNKIASFIVPIVKILLHVRDALAKAQGVMTVALYTVMNIYNIIVSGSINLMKVLSNLILTVIAVMVATSIIGLVLMSTPAFPLGVTMYASAVTMLVVTIIPSILLYTTMRKFITSISDEKPNNPPKKPTLKKKKKKK